LERQCHNGFNCSNLLPLPRQDIIICPMISWCQSKRDEMRLDRAAAQRKLYLVRGYGLSLVQRPLTRFAEFTIGWRFAPTRWQIDLSPLGRGEGHTDSN
jgi:hypothetical protein